MTSKENEMSASFLEKLSLRKITQSVLAIMVIATVCGLAIKGKIDIQAFLVIASAIITFFFKTAVGGNK